MIIQKPYMKYLIPLLLASVYLIACKSSTITLSDDFGNEAFTIEGIKCSDTPGEGTDSKVGVLECEDVSFYYDYGRYSSKGPITPREEFRRSFDTYHHIKFFEDRMIDPKVYKLFLDSVNVVEVRKKEESDPLMFSCDPCNTTAIITFKNDTYHYPITLSEKQLNMDSFKAEFKKVNGFIYKKYQVDGERPSLYVTPIKNRFSKKNCLSLTVKNSNLNDEAINNILDKVILHPIKKNNIK